MPRALISYPSSSTLGFPNSHLECFIFKLYDSSSANTASRSFKCCALLGENTTKSSMYTNTLRPSNGACILFMARWKFVRPKLTQLYSNCPKRSSPYPLWPSGAANNPISDLKSLRSDHYQLCQRYLGYLGSGKRSRFVIALSERYSQQNLGFTVLTSYYGDRTCPGALTRRNNAII